MRNNIITIEDFYDNPLETREWVLKQDFAVRGNYPGQRTISHATEQMKDIIENAVKPLAGKITRFPIGENKNDEPNYNGAYQYTTCHDKTWIHSDSGTTWAAVVYLTPDAPLSGGTGLYRHKSTGLHEWVDDEKVMDLIWSECNDYTKWDLCDTIGNVFNRMILYRGTMFHASLDYFGQDINDGRLFQTFFFDTEY